jgi:FtsH-binding integral membrane protein
MWMCGGLAVTAIVAYNLAKSYAWYNFLLGGSGTAIFIFVVQLGLFFAISFLSKRVSATVIKGLFLVFAASFGLTCSVVVMVYPGNVIFKAFVASASIYAAMAAYGLITKRSLESWGSFLFMGLIGLIVSSIINLFTKSAMADFVICSVGVLVFSGLTAYDNQKLRVIYAGGFENEDAESKTVIFGAITLFLDFLNLFMYLVRLLGNRD